MVPSDPATTLSNEIFETGMKRRLLIELTPVTPSERRKCPVCHKESTCERSVQEPDRSVDEFGDHIVGCKGMLPLRTKLWHDPLVQVWHMLARMAGLSCGKEVSNLMLHSGKRPDVVLFQFLFNILIDIRTVAGADPRYCRAAALNPGHGAVWGAARKNEAWLGHTRPQGDTFIPICHEVGGRQGVQANDLLDKICMSAGGSLSDRTAFKVYALQRLHAATFRGVAAMINARPIWRTGPGIFPGQAVSPRGPAPPRPTINFSSHGCFVPRVFTNTTHMMARDTPGT